MKSYYKNEIAMAAGVSMRTFSRWLSTREQDLCRQGVSKSCHMVPASVVKWICLEYGIDEEELTG